MILKVQMLKIVKQIQTISRFYWKYHLLIFALITLDFFTKSIAFRHIDAHHFIKQEFDFLPFLKISKVWNSGISFGLFNNLNYSNIILIFITIAAILFLLWKIYTEKDKQIIILLSMVIAGATGNLIDRFLFGAVRDFVHLHAWGYSYPVFNFADSYISISLVFLIFKEFITSKKTS